MSKVQPRTLSGFMELLPARQAQFERMAAIIRQSFALYAFTPLDTPTWPCASTSPSPWPSTSP